MNFCSLLLAATVAIGSASAAAAPAGVEGRVSLSPAHPGPQRMGEPSSAPMANQAIELVDRSGAVVGRATTSPDGHFRIDNAAAGRYELRVATQGLYPRCEAVSVILREGQMARIDLACDSGMR